MRCFEFEQGPIRPPSEAGSVLVRVSRNCPWNRCAFCPVYKGARFSRRPVEEVLADIEAMRAQYGEAPRTVFLQDADPLLAKGDDVVRILAAIRSAFPAVSRITAYARSDTLARRPLPDLVRLREAGLDRVHVGMESGCDAVLEMVQKGATRERHIVGGRKAKEAGFELSEYVMPGLGGTRWSAEHADDTASTLAEIRPDFVRLRTTVVAPGTPLAELEQRGEFEALSEVRLVTEIRRFLAGLRGVATRIESDHMMNLLMEIRGDLPGDLDRLLRICDRFLSLSEEDRLRFILARRLHLVAGLDDPRLPQAQARLEAVLQELEFSGRSPEELARELRTRMV